METEAAKKFKSTKQRHVRTKIEQGDTICDFDVRMCKYESPGVARMICNYNEFGVCKYKDSCDFQRVIKDEQEADDAAVRVWHIKQ